MSAQTNRAQTNRAGTNRAETERVRLDVWLWRARFAKTRAAAARLIAEGGVRLLRGDRSRSVDKPSQMLALGDILTIRLNSGSLDVSLASLGVRRGPTSEARLLYEVLSVQDFAAPMDDA